MNKSPNTDKKNVQCECIRNQEMDRKRIANELHDTSIQDLTHVIHQIELAGFYIDIDSAKAKLELASINDEIRKIIKDIRNTIFDLRPMSFDDLGLSGAIENLIDVLNNRFVIDIQADTDFTDDFDELKQLEIYRVIQECLTNAAKHSNAKHITLGVYDKENELFICASDDGIGFLEQQKEDESEDDKQIHYGLQIMKERVSILDGRCYINSIRNKGTKIEILIPR